MTDTEEVRARLLPTSNSGSPYADLVAALGALTEAPRAGKVNAGQRSYKFMTLPDLLGQVRPVFAQHRLAVTQLVHNHETGVSVETRFIHTSGHVFEFPLLTLRCGQDPQSIGSAITYGRRYQLAALVGLAGDDDDDGARATQTPGAAAQPSESKARTRARDHDAPAAPGPPKPPVLTSPPGGHLTGSPQPGTASDQSIKYLWTLLRGLGTDEPGIRTWVANILNIDGDWSTRDLSQQQVSILIDRLKQPPAEDT